MLSIQMISLWPHTEAIQFCERLSVAISPLCTGQEGTADIFIYVVSVLEFSFELLSKGYIC